MFKPFPSNAGRTYINRAEIFGRFNFPTNPLLNPLLNPLVKVKTLYHPIILVSDNCGKIYEALNILIKSDKMSENSRPKFNVQILPSESLCS